MFIVFLILFVASLPLLMATGFTKVVLLGTYAAFMHFLVLGLIAAAVYAVMYQDRLKLATLRVEQRRIRLAASRIHTPVRYP